MPDRPADRRTRRPPVTAVHLGLGAFFRAHQAWYADGAGAGVAAFTGRSPAAARALAAQDGVYALLERGADGDRAELVQSVVAAEDGADRAAWLAAAADPSVGVVTLTVTEAGYRLRADGRLDADAPDVAADRASLAAGGGAATAPGRLVDALRARRRHDAPVAVVPCDNLPDNGALLRGAVLDLAAAVDPGLAAWADERVAFVSTVVDRITPAATPDDARAALRLTGVDDRAPVVAEPESSWLLAGAFPAGRPAWERRGARVVDDVAPFERRKLWLLNGAHSLLAWRGPEEGVGTVAEAMAVPALAAEVEALWDEAAPVVGLPPAEVAAYRDELRRRFGNARIEHRLAQIAAGGTQKLPARVLAPMRARRAAGLAPGAAEQGAVEAWTRWLVSDAGAGDPSSALVRAAAPGDRARVVLEALAPDLA